MGSAIKIIAAICLMVLPVQAATINAASGSYADVSNAVFTATVGDTVQIPAGTNTWTNTLTISKAITISGIGVVNAKLIEEAAGFLTTNTTETMFIDNISPRGPLFTLSNTNTNQVLWLTKMRLSSIAGSAYAAGAIDIKTTDALSNCPPVRVSNVILDGINSRPFTIYAYGNVVIDHCVGLNNVGGIAFDGRAPDSSNRGDLVWANDVPWGTVSSGPVIESCWFTNASFRAITDAFAGGRLVFRYNTTYNLAVENHEMGSRTRGGRSWEAYGNTMNFINAGSGAVPFYFRSGTGLVFSNEVRGVVGGLKFMILNDYRLTDPFTPFGQGNGTNVWDQNDEVDYATGTHTGTNDSQILVDSNKTWTANQWALYAVLNLDSGKAGICLSSGTTNINFLTPVFAANRPWWTNGNSYVIRRVNRSLDQCGAGKGDLLVGGSSSVQPTNQALGIPSWPRHEDYPVYYWNNISTNVAETEVESRASTIVAGRNYTNIALTGYTPLQFPHPLVASNSASVATGVARANNSIVQGSVVATQ